ncbi:hypothetical protein F4780DRAFT_781152 [Xylariomycetidae sp. FL0641]|nr:hypothetical protein F4780DRAFT_781152 [Xylariomycetidae sp. FL0641]
MNAFTGSHRAPRKLVLCFDGTGNKFKGDDSDSNILKIFRCLDREATDQFHYYQPGIGTYVVSSSLTHTGLLERLRSWYLKAKDSAIGSSFDQHVVGGYRFLMRFYEPGDDIYLFGFSRGAYIARFLAEMIDCMGILARGNEEQVRFAWKFFQSWQVRQGDDPKSRAERHEKYLRMKRFRETFSCPVKPIRFLGLFDTVNSVPRFEAAWMQRSKFPYTARSSAKKIRHCVSIDERRAKFRQDLIYQGVHHRSSKGRHPKHQKAHDVGEEVQEKYRAQRQAVSGSGGDDGGRRGRRATLAPPEEPEPAFRPRSHSRTPRASAEGGGGGGGDARSEVSQVVGEEEEGEDEEDDDDKQDIDEIWFSGGHADVGGGWDVVEGTKSASHVPLVYMIREAQRAGLPFNSDKLVEMGLADALDEDEEEDYVKPETSETTTNNNNQGSSSSSDDNDMPNIRIDISSPSPGTTTSTSDATKEKAWEPTHGNVGTQARDTSCAGAGGTAHRRPFHEMVRRAHVAPVHDSLAFGQGLSPTQVLSWRLMEWLPFRRMDLQGDGTWRPIRWPLPRGEVRDIPASARVHGSVVRRLRADAAYRPGNLIVGGGGRGLRRAPDRYGIGCWECVQGWGDPVEEVWVRKTAPPGGK